MSPERAMQIAKAMHAMRLLMNTITENDLDHLSVGSAMLVMMALGRDATPERFLEIDPLVEEILKIQRAG